MHSSVSATAVAYRALEVFLHFAYGQRLDACFAYGTVKSRISVRVSAESTESARNGMHKMKRLSLGVCKRAFRRSESTNWNHGKIHKYWETRFIAYVNVCMRASVCLFLSPALVIQITCDAFFSIPSVIIKIQPFEHTSHSHSLILLKRENNPSTRYIFMHAFNEDIASGDSIALLMDKQKQACAHTHESAHKQNATKAV